MTDESTSVEANGSVARSTSGEDGASARMGAEDCPSSSQRMSLSQRDPWQSNPNGRTPGILVRRREHKWLKMISNWERTMKHKHDKVKDRCRKGIPQSVRAKAWMLLSGAENMKQKSPGRFEELMASSADERVMDEIQRDLHRTFPEYEMFKSPLGYGQADLCTVLKCYALHNPAIGYCQAMAPVAACLLMVMPAEDAFWMLMTICDNYLPNYYAKGLTQLQVDADILKSVVRTTLPDVHKFLTALDVHPLLYMTEWFMCLFTRTLEWSCVLRVLDMFFSEGVKVLFRVAAAILSLTLGTSAQRRKYPGQMEVSVLLRKLPDDVIVSENLLPVCLKLNITSKDMARRHTQQLEKKVNGRA